MGSGSLGSHGAWSGQVCMHRSGFEEVHQVPGLSTPRCTVPDLIKGTLPYPKPTPRAIPRKNSKTQYNVPPYPQRLVRFRVHVVQCRGKNIQNKIAFRTAAGNESRWFRKMDVSFNSGRNQLDERRPVDSNSRDKFHTEELTAKVADLFASVMRGPWRPRCDGVRTSTPAKPACGRRWHTPGR